MKKLLYGSLLMLAMLICVLPFAKGNNYGTSDSVFSNASEVSTYLKDKYTGESVRNIKVNNGTETKLDSKNYSQSDIRNYYNSMVDSSEALDGGICWAAATTSLLKYNGASDSASEVGYKLLKYGVSKNWVSPSSTGLNFSHSDQMVTYGCEQYDISKKGNNDYYNIYSNLKKEVDNKQVVIFSIVGHAMTGCGYTTFTVKYEQKNLFGKWKSKTTTEDFVICNDTWSNYHQYSYFPVDEIGTNVFTRWDFGITKLKNK